MYHVFLNVIVPILLKKNKPKMFQKLRCLSKHVCSFIDKYFNPTKPIMYKLNFWDLRTVMTGYNLDKIVVFEEDSKLPRMCPPYTSKMYIPIQYIHLERNKKRELVLVHFREKNGFWPAELMDGLKQYIIDTLAMGGNVAISMTVEFTIDMIRWLNANSIVRSDDTRPEDLQEWVRSKSIIKTRHILY